MTRGAAGQRCESCRVPLPRGAARCPSCGHEPGAAIIAGAPRDDIGVAVGTTPRPRRQLVVVGAVVLGLVALLAVLDGGGTDTSARPAPTTTSTSSSTTTTTRRPVVTAAPTTSTPMTLPPLVLGEPSGVKLLIQGDRSTQIVDLDTGEVSTPPDVLNSFVLGRAGGVVLSGRNGPGSNGGATFLAAPYTGEPVPIAPIPVGQVFQSAADDRVWIVDGSGPPFTAVEVSVTGEVTTPAFELPVDGYVAGAVSRGLVISAHGSIFVTRGTGDLESLGAGDVVGTSGRWLATIACDTAGRCPLTIVDVVSGSRHPIEGPPSTGQGTFSPDGRWFAFVDSSGIRSPALWLIDREAAVAEKQDVAVLGFNGSLPAFSADGRWLFIISGNAVRAIRTADGTVVDVPLTRMAQVNQLVVLP